MVLTSVQVAPLSVENSITPASKLRLLTESRSKEWRWTNDSVSACPAATPSCGDTSSTVAATLADRQRYAWLLLPVSTRVHNTSAGGVGSELVCVHTVTERSAVSVSDCPATSSALPGKV